MRCFSLVKAFKQRTVISYHRSSETTLSPSHSPSTTTVTVHERDSERIGAIDSRSAVLANLSSPEKARGLSDDFRRPLAHLDRSDDFRRSVTVLLYPHHPDVSEPYVSKYEQRRLWHVLTSCRCSLLTKDLFSTLTYKMPCFGKSSICASRNFHWSKSPTDRRRDRDDGSASAVECLCLLVSRRLVAELWI